MTDIATNQEWLDQVQEEALEPDLPIIDPHHHLWDFKVERVNPRYFLDEILVDTNAGHNIVSTVFIECHAMFLIYRLMKYQSNGNKGFILF